MSSRLNPLALPTLAVASLAVPAALAQPLAISQTNPLQPSAAVDGIRANLGGGGFTDLIASADLPAGLGLPVDIDYNPTDGLLYVVASAEDEGQNPLAGGLGSIWTVDPDTGAAMQIVDGLNAPQFVDLSADGATLFFTEQGTGAGATFQNDGRVWRLDLTTPGATPELIVTAPPSGGVSGVDFDPDTGALFYMVRNQGEPANNVQQIRRVADPFAAAALAPGTDELFFEDDTAQFLSAGRNLAVRDDSLYYVLRNIAFGTSPGRINRLPLDFAGDTSLIETVIEGQFIIDFVIDGASVWYTDALGANVGQLLRTTLAGGDAAALATGQGFGSLPIGVALIDEPGSPCAGVVDLAPPSGVLDLADVTAFAQGFTAQDPAADFDGNGIFDLNDVTGFVTAFAAGCP